MSKPSLLVGTGNVHDEVPGIKKVLRMGAAVNNFNEARSGRCTEYLENRRGIRLYPTHDQLLGLAGKEPLRGIARVTAATNLNILGSGLIYFCDAWEPALRVAPPRRGAFVDFEHPLATARDMKGFRFLGAHPSAGPDSLRGEQGRDHPLLQRYEQFWDVAGAHLTAGRRIGLIPILAGDLQLPEGLKLPWSPERQFRQLQMNCVSTKIDYIGFGVEVRATGPRKTVQLYDHVGMAQRLG